ncbi:hypothetical protein ScalyP_jg3108 [Parmales sp. scaly parma]|nr:hypothetical protein ScalyP_jg3108 [Parmales sp. scaly parma]
MFFNFRPQATKSTKSQIKGPTWGLIKVISGSIEVLHMLLVFLPLLSALLFSSSIPSIKRNLVQESFTQKKVELLSLLSQTSRTKTKQKIEDLVNTFVLLNPLSTTTDSNLLDGDWALAYHTTATASEQDKKFGQRTSPLFSHHLCFNLEADDDDHYPFATVVRSSKLLGGFLTLQTAQEITELSRTDVSSVTFRRKIKILNFVPIPLPVLNNYGDEDEFSTDEVDVLFVDGDLCICAKQNNEIAVYTKNRQFNSLKQKLKRKLNICASLPFSVLRKVGFGFGLGGGGREAGSGRGGGRLYYEIESQNSKLTALQLGEVVDSVDGDGGVDYDINDDPLGNLSEDERQEAMAKMSLKELKIVEEAISRNEFKRAAERKKKEEVEEEEKKKRRLTPPPKRSS